MVKKVAKKVEYEGKTLKHKPTTPGEIQSAYFDKEMYSLKEAKVNLKKWKLQWINMIDDGEYYIFEINPESKFDELQNSSLYHGTFFKFGKPKPEAEEEKEEFVDAPEQGKHNSGFLKFIAKVPFSTTGHGRELHFFVPGTNIIANWMGPNTDVEWRYNFKLGRPNDFSEPINGVDYLCMLHDLDYYNADRSANPDEGRKEADVLLLQRLDEVKPTTLVEKAMKWLAQSIISGKMKLGYGIKKKHIRKLLGTGAPDKGNKSIEINKLIQNYGDL
jgi:hypothetical protein